MKRALLLSVFAVLFIGTQQVSAITTVSELGNDMSVSNNVYSPNGHLIPVPLWGSVIYNESVSGQQYDLYVSNGGSVLQNVGSSTDYDGYDVQNGDMYGAIADLNSDSFPDLVGRRYVSYLGKNELYVDMSDGTSISLWPYDTYGPSCPNYYSFAIDAARGYKIGRGTDTLALADLNYDGSPDIVYSQWPTECNNELQIHNVGSASHHLKVSDLVTDFGSNGHISNQPVIGDYNGDGCADVAVSVAYYDTTNTYRTKTVAYNQRDGVLWRADSVFGASAVSYDFDNDGKDEIAIANGTKVQTVGNGGVAKEYTTCAESLQTAQVTAGGGIQLLAMCTNGRTDAYVNVFDAMSGASHQGYPVTLANNTINGPAISFNIDRQVDSNDIMIPTEKGIVAIDGNSGALLATAGAAMPFDDVAAVVGTGSQVYVVGQTKQIAALSGRRVTYAYNFSTDSQRIIDTDLNRYSYLEFGYDGTHQLSVDGFPISQADGGYRFVASDGGVFPFGNKDGFGSTGNIKLWKPIVGMSETSTNQGYWLVASDGGIFPFGDAKGYGSTGNIKLWQPIVGMERTSTNNGYWLVASDGGIFPFGDARGYGSAGGIRLNKPIVGMAATPTGNGYWLVASDGGIFPFGDARGYGSTGNIRLTKPIVGMAATATGKGYWLVASDGGIFPFGDAVGYGSAGNIDLWKPIVGMKATPTGKGYWLVASDGGVFTYGDAKYYGSTGNIDLWQPIVGVGK